MTNTETSYKQHLTNLTPEFTRFVQLCYSKENEETQKLYTYLINKLIFIFLDSTKYYYSDRYTAEYFLMLLFLSAFRLSNKFLDDNCTYTTASTFCNNLTDYYKDIVVLNQIEVKMLKFLDYNILKLIRT